MKRITAIILAAGVGKRMNSNIPKQYLKINDKEILYYTIRAFEMSKVDDIVIVTGQDDMEYCKHEIVEKYSFVKVKQIVVGGNERFNSVNNGLNAIVQADYVMIHDGARPCIEIDDINNMIDCVIENNACIMAVKAKDTIKIVKDGYIIDSPNRELMWQAQTPQVFEYNKIKDAYNNMIKNAVYEKCNITDDASVWSLYNTELVKIYEGKYTNLKITTPEDIDSAKKNLELA
ncbi:MAG: 2-C-methyl-D-erythritol 4-phosphate cytidylyltransferase [Lachnospiraceae bacterium]|nr:2-C-methyl-D-erythritol 4-phosphate cytidylyltransferase [Lachnospiraceae bacterium]